jgi:hypothetical protein
VHLSSELLSGAVIRGCVAVSRTTLKGASTNVKQKWAGRENSLVTDEVVGRGRETRA